LIALRHGQAEDMRRVIQKRIRRTGEGIDLAVDLNAVIAINDGREEPEAEADRAEDAPGPDEANEQGRTTS
jgi:hypothetical protein